MMGRIAPGAVLIALAALCPAPAAAAPCPARPMPAALDSVPALPEGQGGIGFSATPWEYPGRAWVVRALPERGGAGTVEIVRLRRQLDCNRYEVEKRWRAPLPAAEYKALAEAVAPLGIAPPGTFLPGGGHRETAVDGTGIELRLGTFGWTVTRQLVHEGPKGGAVSALFRALVARHVPAAELPEENWRTRRAAGAAMRR